MKKALIIFVISLITSGIWAQFNGSGTAGSPYLINNTTELAELARRVNNGTDYEGTYFKLTTNLDLSGWDSGDGYGWKPIGNYIYIPETSERIYTSFKGKFDGNNKVINKLTINRFNENGLGLFGCVDNAEIKNIGLINVDITSDVASSSIGGLVGQNLNSQITNCFVSGYIRGGLSVGGLVGGNDNGSITNCYTLGQVRGDSPVGGLVGYLYESTISYSYSACWVNGRDYVGGLVGIDSEKSKIVNSVAANPSVSGSGMTPNRIVGGSGYPSEREKNNYANADMQINYFAMDADTNQDYNGIDKSLTELQSADFYINPSNWEGDKAWDLQSSHNDAKLWNIWEGNSYPYFQWQSAPAIFTSIVSDNVNGIYRTDDNRKIDSITFYLNGIYHSSLKSPNDGRWNFSDTVSEFDTLSVVINETGKAATAVNSTEASDISMFSEGAGTITDPFKIKDVTTLAQLARRVNNGWGFKGMHFILDTDLDLSGWDSGDHCGWKPIGFFALPNRPFKGVFDGNQKIISELTINRPEESGLGLFGCTEYAEIKNLGLFNVNIKGDDYVGGLVGRASRDTISNCYVTGQVEGLRCIGGLTGLTTGYINNSYAKVDVNGTDEVGGLAGVVAGPYIPAGRSLYGFVNYSFATGKVSGTNNFVGGLVGSADNGSITNSMVANLSITGEGDFFNRFIGGGYAKVFNNYMNAEMLVNGSIVNDSDENATEKVPTELQSAKFYTNGSNWYEGKAWDLQASHAEDKTWNLWEGNSFPYFQWQSAPAVFTGDDEISGIYRTDDNQTTDSLVFYLNGTYQSTLITPRDGKWFYAGSLTKNDILTVVVYETGRMPSSLDITGVSIDVSNELIISNNRVWSTNGHIFVNVESSMTVQVYSLSGALVNTLPVTAGETRNIALPTGIYVVKAGNQSYKVVVN